MTIFLILFIVIMGYWLVNWYLNENASEEKEEAVLIKKKAITSVDANGIAHSSYALIFDIKGNTKKFNVNYNKYKKFSENQKGILIYKRKRFVDFVLK